MTPPRPRPTPEVLAALYAAAGSAAAAGAQLGVSKATVLTWLRAAGIPVAPRGPHPQPPHHPWRRENARPEAAP